MSQCNCFEFFIILIDNGIRLVDKNSYVIGLDLLLFPYHFEKIKKKGENHNVFLG